MATVVEVRERDGTILEDIAGFCMDKQLTRRLNRPASFTFRVPSYMVNEIQADGYPLLTTGRRQISVELDSAGLFFHGLVWTIEEEGDEDMVYSQVTCYDPMMLWRYRPARDLVDSYTGDAGNLSDPSFIERNQNGGPIMEEILLASENDALIPAEAEGQLFIDLAASTFAGGGADLRGAPLDWPATLAEVATVLTNTGELDIVLEPIIGPLGSTVYPTAEQFMNMAEVHTYTGSYGTDLTGSVHFDYATGDNNVRLFRRAENMDTVINKLWYYLGPRLDQQHWRSNITADHPDIPTDIYTAALFSLISTSRDEIGVMMQSSIYDNFGSGTPTLAAPTESSVYQLFIRQWMVESLLRANPRKMSYITPVRSGTTLPQGGDVFEPGDFDIGDLVAVNIGNKARLAETGAQRIYQYTIDIDDDGVEAFGEFVCSPDQDSI